MLEQFGEDLQGLFILRIDCAYTVLDVLLSIIGFLVL